jgi:hypothetical protein
METTEFVDFKGTLYEVPLYEPRDDRDPSKLHPITYEISQAYLDYANPRLPSGWELRRGECRRTVERQAFLYAKSRTPRLARFKPVSWTMESWHRAGLAVDLVLVVEGKAEWTPSVWREMYADLPPEFFGLRTIPQELVHVEVAHAAEIAARPEDFGVSWS